MWYNLCARFLGISNVTYIFIFFKVIVVFSQNKYSLYVHFMYMISQVILLAFMCFLNFWDRPIFKEVMNNYVMQSQSFCEDTYVTPKGVWSWDWRSCFWNGPLNPCSSIVVTAQGNSSRSYKTSGALCNMAYPSKMHLKLKSREVSFAHNLFRSSPIILKFCTEPGSDTTILFINIKFQNDWTTKTDVMEERDFVRVELKMTFGQISYTARPSFILGATSQTFRWLSARLQ